MEIAGKRLAIHHVDGPVGVRGRRSDNALIRARLGWAPNRPLREGLQTTYRWIEAQAKAGNADREPA
jgi:nucleoside-diphosphate-sugar epimerase